MLYDVMCLFTDGSESKYEGLTHQDLIVIVETFDNLAIRSCIITAVPQ